MINRYSVGFLIPKNTRRILSDDGWEFESDSRIPLITEMLLSKYFSLIQSSLDHSEYEREGVKMDVFKDENGEIENIYFRFYTDIRPELLSILKNSECCENLEFFTPHK